jgi:hypothetical protein
MSIYEPPEGFVYERGYIDWWWGWSHVDDLKAQPEATEATDPYAVHGPWHGSGTRPSRRLWITQ